MNYTNVKRVGDFFSITNKNEAERLDIELCDKCANVDVCGIRQTMREQSQIIAPIKRCKVFSPYLTFSVLDGLDAPEFNTARVYGAWAKRLSVGDKVYIYDSLNDEVLGTRTVTASISGDKQAMLKEHASKNHALINKNIANPAQELEKILIRSMGKNFYNNSQTLSVIYLA